ncbi:Ddx4 [Symbiodinium natans]|uniref:Ddx4 protein n=1 Tax=Symbiodinium natans TaxID=878477 RepID=A0A812QE38_9DINO|nr:Ddx4 [Symbiodinium natans]
MCWRPKLRDEEVFADILGSFSVHPTLQQNIARIDGSFSSPLSDLQRFVIVLGLCQRDLLCIAPAGFGQWAAALVSMLAVTNRHRKIYSEPRQGLCPDALILCATDAACNEVAELGEKLAKGTDLQCLRCDAGSQGPGGLVLVATPQELLEFKEQVDLKDCFGLVLHGASTMLDMGLMGDLRRITKHHGMPKADHRHTMVFGSHSPRLKELASELLFVPLTATTAPSPWRCAE